MYRGKTTSGDKMGRKLGFPTLNITLSPCDMGKIFSSAEAGNTGGVFFVEVFLAEYPGKFSGLLHLGSRPTFDKPELRVEIFLLNFNQEITENSGVHFQIHKKIRDIISFKSSKELIAQINKDVATAKNILKEE